jgi:hypothetical protein
MVVDFHETWFDCLETLLQHHICLLNFFAYSCLNTTKNKQEQIKKFDRITQQDAFPENIYLFHAIDAYISGNILF